MASTINTTARTVAPMTPTTPTRAPQSAETAGTPSPEAAGAAGQHDVVRNDAGTFLMRASSVVGLFGTALAWGRWGAAFNHAKEQGKLARWATAMLPMVGTGPTNDIVPIATGHWRTAYRTANIFGTAMSMVAAGIAIPNLAIGFKQGWEHSDGGPIEQALGGVTGLVATRAGRTGLMGAVGPALTAGIILGAGWGARSEGLMAVIRAGQDSPLRGSVKLAMVGIALGPLMMLNESGALDMFNMDRPATDTRDAGEVFIDGVRGIPETIRSLSAPYIPQDWVPQP